MTTRKTSPSQSDGLAGNPVALIAGGIALGAVVGMLIPRLAKERELLDPVGKKLADRATATVNAVRETSKAEIDSLLPPRDAARDRVSQLIDNVLEAAKGAAAKA